MKRRLRHFPAARPIVKWAGGKGQLLDQYEPLLPDRFGAYHEPFVGGGAIFFALHGMGRLSNKAVHLSDGNAELINFYQVVRDDVDSLIELVRRHKEHHCRDYYYTIRAMVPVSPSERAARFLYLNQTCYNGLYRVNRRGLFNVPIGTYRNPRILYEQELRLAAVAFKQVEFALSDFASVLNRAVPGDFVYLDPPYNPLSHTANFTHYTADAFDDQGQSRLAKIVLELDRRGCLCMVSNSDTPLVRQLYPNFRVTPVRARRMLNRNGEGRGLIQELIITNY